MNIKQWTCVLSAAFLMQHCMKWERGWNLELTERDFEAGLVEQADRLFAEAGSRPQLVEAIDAYRAAGWDADGARHSLNRLSESHILYGAAYAKTRREKRDWYHRGIQYAERALYHNVAFRQQVQSGAGLDEAALVLQAEDLRAMLLWVTGVSYFYKECLNGVGHVVHFKWVEQSRAFLERMLVLDRRHEHGAVLFSLAIFDIALPKSAGGDLARANQWLDEALMVGDQSLLIRWGRAKYYFSRTGDQAAFREDLNWVLAQDPKLAQSPYPWNIYFQSDAKAMLASL